MTQIQREQSREENILYSWLLINLALLNICTDYGVPGISKHDAVLAEIDIGSPYRCPVS